jgi:TRAP-type C4-dicarboxylate transport system substrate-binding protein
MALDKDTLAELPATVARFLRERRMVPDIAGRRDRGEPDGIERFSRDVRRFRICEGATRIQQLIIARGMPKDARVPQKALQETATIPIEPKRRKAMQRRLTIKCLSALLLGAVAVIPAGSANAQATKLKFSTMEAPSDPFVGCFTMPLLAELTKATGGRIDFETYMGGTAFAHPLKQFEQAAKGVMDISQGVLSYTPGQFALTEVATMPFLVEDAAVASAAINRLATKLLADEFKDIHLMAILVTPPLYVHMRGDASTLDDLKGKRVRATGQGATNLLKGLGVTPVAMPAPGVYENLQKGVIDGALAEFTALQAFRIGEVTKSHLMANVSSALLFIGMNKEKLASLPADIQEIVRTKFSGPEIGVRAAECWQKLGEQVAAKLKSEGHSFVAFSPAERAKAMPLAKDVTDEYIAGLETKGKKAREFHDAFVAEMKKAAAERTKK